MHKWSESGYESAVLNVLMNSTNEWYVIIDHEGLILAMSKAYKEFVGDLHPEGKYVHDVIENTRMHEVVKTGVAEIGEVQMIRGNKMIASRIPIFKGNEVVGAVGKAIFKDIDELFKLFNKVQREQRKISIYVEPNLQGSSAKYTFDSIQGTSHYTRDSIHLAMKAAKTDSSVLIVGPSGTGKELYAHSIHHASKRSHGPFIMINCAAIPSELLESELFGYEQGAFTGANRQGRKGKFELANKGTIFLDEIGDMPIAMQVKLLRVLQSKEVDRVGGNTPVPVDVRVIAATNKNIDVLVEDDRFRMDLFYRLNVMRIDLTSLKDRSEEIEGIATYVLDKLSQKMGILVHGFTKQALEALITYEWPGNIRELENVIERALNLLEDDLYIDLTLLPNKIIEKAGCAELKVVYELSNTTNTKLSLNDIESALILTKGNKKKAAQLLGISRAGLYKKLNQAKSV